MTPTRLNPDPHEQECRELVELVTDYLEGAMSAAEVARFEAHLGVCEGCVVYVEQIRATVAVTGTLAAGDLPAGAREALLGQFRAWRSGNR